MEATSLWERLRKSASQADSGAFGLWDWLKEKLDLAQYRPEPVPEVVERRLAGRDGPYHILKNPEAKTYYRLSDRDYFLWKLMDGTKTVKELVVAYFMEYGAFAFARVGTLVSGLRANLFLQERPVYVYRRVRRELLQRRPSYRLQVALGAFFEKQFAVTGLDRWLAGVYRCGAWLLYAWPLLVTYAALSVVGLYCFYQVCRSARYGFISIGGSTGLGMVSLLLANLAVLLFHELGHALTVKHFGREVRRGGFMIYMGMPAFFVDTMDIWLEGVGARLAVTWAGPYSGLILGGLASIILVTRPGFPLNPFLYQFAFVAYLTVFFNLNPLLELDGYYLLMDGLGIPLLRRRSLDFVRAGLWQKLRELRGAEQTLRNKLSSFSREEWIFTAFGLLSAAWTAYALFAATSMWQSRLLGSMQSLLSRGGDQGKRFMSLAIVAISLPFVAAIALQVAGTIRRALDWAGQKGMFQNTWRVAAMLGIAVAAVTAAPGYLHNLYLRPSLNLLTLAAAACLAWRAAQDYAGSRLAASFWLLAVCAVGFWTSEAGTWAVYQHLLSSSLARPLVVYSRHLAYLSLFLAALGLLAGTQLRRLPTGEKVLLILGVVASLAVPVDLVRSLPTAVSNASAFLDITGSLFPLLAMTLLVPTLFSFGRTRYASAWLGLTLAAAGWAAAVLWSRYPLLSYSLLASSLFMHHLARRQSVLAPRLLQAPVTARDEERLQQAFLRTANGVLSQLHEAAGQRQAAVLAERFNDYAMRACWPVRIHLGQMSDLVPEVAPPQAGREGLIEKGEVFSDALNVVLDLAARELGEKWMVRVLQQAYDALPWQEREVAGAYLFPGVRRADALSQQFLASRQSHLRLLRRMPLFVTTDLPEIELLLSCLKSERYRAGQVIVRQGDRGDAFYIIAEGHVEVTQRNERGVSEVINQLDRGDYFGELALLSDAPRSATCRAAVPTEVLSLYRKDFDRLVKERFALRKKVDQSIARVELLRRMPLFAELDSQQVQLIAAQLKEQTYAAKDVVIRQGEIGETFYMIESGRLQVSVARDGGEQVVAERGPGEYVGEIALLQKIPRTATVRALTEAHVLALQKTDFDRLVVPHLYVSRGLERETSRRMIDLRRVADAS